MDMREHRLGYRETVRKYWDVSYIDICLDRGDHSILLAWVEVDRHGSTPALKLRLYADCKDDEPTDDRTIAPAELDEYFNGLANGGTELV